MGAAVAEYFLRDEMDIALNGHTNPNAKKQTRNEAAKSTERLSQVMMTSGHAGDFLGPSERGLERHRDARKVHSPPLFPFPKA